MRSVTGSTLMLLFLMLLTHVHAAQEHSEVVPIDLNDGGKVTGSATPIAVDTTGDGKADMLAIDTTGDHKPDTLIAPDAKPTSSTAQVLPPTNTVPVDMNDNGKADGKATPIEVDTTGDGKADAIAIDTNHDGKPDTEIIPEQKNLNFRQQVPVPHKAVPQKVQAANQAAAMPQKPDDDETKDFRKKVLTQVAKNTGMKLATASTVDLTGNGNPDALALDTSGDGKPDTLIAPTDDDDDKKPQITVPAPPPLRKPQFRPGMTQRLRQHAHQQELINEREWDEQHYGEPRPQMVRPQALTHNQHQRQHQQHHSGSHHSVGRGLAITLMTLVGVAMAVYVTKQSEAAVNIARKAGCGACCSHQPMHMQQGHLTRGNSVQMVVQSARAKDTLPAEVLQEVSLTPSADVLAHQWAIMEGATTASL